MALGIDTLWAKLALENSLLLWACIPFRGQESIWPDKSKAIYQMLLEYSYIKDYISDPGYASYKMQKRNEFMVDNCDILIAVWDESNGGTKNCIDYAKSVNKQIIYINPKDFK